MFRTWSLSRFCVISDYCLNSLLNNRVRTEDWKTCANRGPVCPSVNFQWCAEPCFLGVAIIRGRCPPPIPRRDKRKSLLMWSVSYGGLVWCWRLITHFSIGGARDSVVGWGAMLQAGRSLVRFPMRWIFFNWPNPSSRTMALGSTQTLTETSTRNHPGGVKSGRRLRLTTLPPSVSRLSR
jgi:hypothetical protein